MKEFNMSLRVNLKLQLSKIKKVVVVKYNTFEKATFDEFIMASLALHTKNDIEAYNYIEDITGSGSLNPHFKYLYKQALQFDKNQLEKIMESSYYPILKVDKENWYYYYPQLDLSEYRNKLYQGDLGELDNVMDIIRLAGVDLVEKSVVVDFTYNKPEPFWVTLDRDSVELTLKGEQIRISEQLFNEIRVDELTMLDKYQGTLFDNVSGSNWKILTDSVIDYIVKNKLSFFEGGKHYAIQNDGCRITTVAKASGLCIYQEENTRYAGNKELCEKVANHIINNDLIGLTRESILLNIIKYIKDDLIQTIVNMSLNRADSKEIARCGLRLLESGILRGWSSYAQESFLKFATGLALQNLYIVNNDLNYSIDQLLTLDKTKLSDKHRYQVEQYLKDLAAKKATIREITGLVTTSGLRERVKAITADAETKRFSRLCNDLIGHVNKDLEKASLAETNQWLEQAIQLKAMMTIIEQKLQNEVKK